MDSFHCSLEDASTELKHARRFLFEHDLFGKPVPTFPDHALDAAADVAVARKRKVPEAAKPPGPGFEA
jgi:hypothetical protein